MTLDDKIHELFSDDWKDRQDLFDYSSMFWNNPWRAAWVNKMLNNIKHLDRIDDSELAITQKMATTFFNQLPTLTDAFKLNVSNFDPVTKNALTALSGMSRHVLFALGFDRGGSMGDVFTRLSELCNVYSNTDGTPCEIDILVNSLWGALPDYLSRNMNTGSDNDVWFNTQMDSIVPMMLDKFGVHDRATKIFRDVFIGNDFDKCPDVLDRIIAVSGVRRTVSIIDNEHTGSFQELLVDILRHVLNTPASTRVIRADRFESAISPSGSEFGVLSTAISSDRLDKLFDDFLVAPASEFSSKDQDAQFKLLVNLKWASLTSKRDRGVVQKYTESEVVSIAQSIEKRLPAITNALSYGVRAIFSSYLPKPSSQPAKNTADMSPAEQFEHSFLSAFKKNDPSFEKLLEHPDAGDQISALIRSPDSLDTEQMIRAVSLWSKHGGSISDLEVATRLVNFFAHRFSKPGDTSLLMSSLPNRSSIGSTNVFNDRDVNLWLYRTFNKKHRKIFANFGLSMILSIPDLDLMRPAYKFTSRLSFWIPEKTIANVFEKINQSDKASGFHELWAEEFFPGRGRHCVALCKLMADTNNLEDITRTVQAFSNNTPVKVMKNPMPVDIPLDFLQVTS